MKSQRSLTLAGLFLAINGVVWGGIYLQDMLPHRHWAYGPLLFSIVALVTFGVVLCFGVLFKSAGGELLARRVSRCPECGCDRYLIDSTNTCSDAVRALNRLKEVKNG